MPLTSSVAAQQISNGDPSGVNMGSAVTPIGFYGPAVGGVTGLQTVTYTTCTGQQIVSGSMSSGALASSLAMALDRLGLLLNNSSTA